MNCSKCNSSWTSNSIVTKCPFCGADIAGEEVQKQNIYDNSKDALAYIMHVHGADVLLGSTLKSFFNDYAPRVEISRKNVIFFVSSSGAADILKRNMAADDMGHESAFRQAVQRVIDTYGIERGLVESVVGEFADALGWKVNIESVTVQNMESVKKMSISSGRTENVQTSVAELQSVTIGNLMKRAYIYLEDGEWKNASDYCNRVLDIEPEYAEAYVGLLMTELHVCSREMLKDCDKPFDGSNNYKRALRFADSSLSDTLKGYISHINVRNENRRLTDIYNNAVGTMQSANTVESYKAAHDMFKMIPGFKDADMLAKKCLAKAENLKNALKIRQRNIKFGRYNWRVLDIQNGKALLLSEDVIEQRRYHDECTNVTWEKCSLRRYLNGEFLKNFSNSEQNRIVKSIIENKNNPWYGTKGGSDTRDNIFLLSIEEVVRYFGDSGQLRNRPKQDNWKIEDEYDEKRMAKHNRLMSWWWLRSPGYDSDAAADVRTDGAVRINGINVNNGYGGVRPALWINL